MTHLSVLCIHFIFNHIFFPTGFTGWRYWETIFFFFLHGILIVFSSPGMVCLQALRVPECLSIFCCSLMVAPDTCSLIWLGTFKRAVGGILNVKFITGLLREFQYQRGKLIC